MSGTEGITKATVTIFPYAGTGDPTSVREKGLVGAERIKALTEDFASMAKAYGMKEEDIDTSVEGEITLTRPTPDALVAAKYLSYTKLSPFLPNL